MSNKVILERDKKFSECCLWQLQREYFDREGVDAWVNQVPFYVTSNPFIANCYASMVMAFIRDWTKKHPESKKHPFYILELGTGPGRFSFYVLKKIYELRRQYGMQDIPIRYVMSDFTQHNLQYWESHPALKLFLDEGLLDFAIYNMEEDTPIQLVRSKTALSPETLTNPLIVFANYIFDTVSHDAFAVNNGKLYELLVTMSTDKFNMREDKPADWEKIAIDYIPHEVNQPHYPDEHFNAVLEEYRTHLTDSSFLMPIGGLRAIKKLLKLSNNKLFLISSDKGYSSLESMDHLAHPRPAFHGSLSMMVNFHAIASYFKHRGDDFILQTPRKGIKTVAFCSGFKLTDLGETALIAQQTIETFSPADYFTLHRRISDSYNECSLEVLASHLALTDWDPHIFMRINNRLCSLLDSSDETTIDFLAVNMPKILANFYPLPKADNVPFEIAYFFHTAKRYPDAVKYYQLAQTIAGEQFGLVYNTALCQFYMGDKENALTGFKHAAEINPQSREAQDWIEHIESGRAKK